MWLFCSVDEALRWLGTLSSSSGVLACMDGHSRKTKWYHLSVQSLHCCFTQPCGILLNLRSSCLSWPAQYLLWIWHVTRQIQLCCSSFFTFCCSLSLNKSNKMQQKWKMVKLTTERGLSLYERREMLQSCSAPLRLRSDSVSGKSMSMERLV